MYSHTDTRVLQNVVSYKIQSEMQLLILITDNDKAADSKADADTDANTFSDQSYI